MDEDTDEMVNRIKNFFPGRNIDPENLIAALEAKMSPITISHPRKDGRIIPHLLDEINPLLKDEGLAEPLPLLEVRLTLRELDEDDVKELFAVIQGFTDNFDLSCSEMPVEEEDYSTKGN